ncbi:MAG: GNAT family N-acetyltransferase [Thermoplasmata archaeon]
MIRELMWSDLDALIENYYSYYEEAKENPDLGISFYHSKPDYQSEIDWFSDLYKSVKSGDAVAVVAEEDGKAVGLCEARRIRPGTELSHVATVGISLRKDYRGRGLGKAMMHLLIDRSRGKFEILRLEVFTVNRAAIDLYRKLGFVEYGMMPRAIKRGSRYYDELLMYYEI